MASSPLADAATGETLVQTAGAPAGETLQTALSECISRALASLDPELHNIFEEMEKVTGAVEQQQRDKHAMANDYQTKINEMRSPLAKAIEALNQAQVDTPILGV